MFQTKRRKYISDFATLSSHLHLRVPHISLFWQSSSSHLHLRVPHISLFSESSSSHLHLRVPYISLLWESSSSHLHLRVPRSLTTYRVNSHLYLLCHMFLCSQCEQPPALTYCATCFSVHGVSSHQHLRLPDVSPSTYSRLKDPGMIFLYKY